MKGEYKDIFVSIAGRKLCLNADTSHILCSESYIKDNFSNIVDALIKATDSDMLLWCIQDNTYLVNMGSIEHPNFVEVVNDTWLCDSLAIDKYEESMYFAALLKLTSICRKELRDMYSYSSEELHRAIDQFVNYVESDWFLSPLKINVDSTVSEYSYSDYETYIFDHGCDIADKPIICIVNWPSFKRNILDPAEILSRIESYKIPGVYFIDVISEITMLC